MFCRASHSEFIAVSLADDHSSGIFQCDNDSSVIWGHPVFKDAAGACCRHVGSADDVFDDDRDAGKRSGVPSLCYFSVDLGSTFYCSIFSYVEHSMDVAFFFFYPPQARLHNICTGKSPCFDPIDDF